MAPARKKQQHNESKVGIIIALALFMLTSAVLGYLTYEFNSQIETANASTEDAKKEKAAADALRREDQNRVILYKSFLGLATSDEKKLLDTAAPGEALDNLKKEHAKLMESVNDQIKATVKAEDGKTKPDGFKLKPTEMLTWPWPDGGTLAATPGPKAMPVWFVEALAERNREVKRAEQLVVELDAEKKKLVDELKAYDDSKTALAKVVADVPVKAAAAEAARDKRIEDRLKLFEEEAKKYNREKGALEAKQNELNAIADEANKLAAQNKLLKEQLAAKEAEKEDVFPYDTPKGTLLIRRKDGLVEIDLGFADNAKPGLTFNVMPAEVRERGLQSRIRNVKEGKKEVQKILAKGTIEVLEVLGPNLSTARITDELEPVREPIMRTDILYNAAWRKGQPDHIVLVGVFDVDGDGTDDIKQVERELRRMGIIVDAYYDLVDRKWVGGVPNKRTNTVVVGEQPIVTAGDALRAAKDDVIKAIALARQEAVNEGAKAIHHRDFFPRIGYKVKFDVTDERINQAAARFIRTGGGEAPPPAPPADPPKN